uniref:Muscular LMNA interacting protein n=1 Tax=Moschus moschiferus TaxID=68415 RepID=A0A8C6FSZ7_MOSMO
VGSWYFGPECSFDSSEYLTLNVGSRQEREREVLTSEVKDKASQGREFKEKKPQGMQQSDLFKAEYVFIVDSEGEEEAPGRKGDQGPPVGTGPPAARPTSLAISSSLASDAVRPKTRGADLQAPSHPERLQAMAPQQRHGQMPTTLPRAAGRETKYANLSSPSSTVSESQLTKPGVIRPVLVKSKILLKKEEEVYEPNPFSKYLEDNSDFFSEQLSHPMMAIPEHETLDSKEQ